MNKWLVGIGLAITVIYTVLGAWILGAELAEIRTLRLNELGDFLAGVFGPLALLWLILGFLQQGIELRQTRETLALQAEELRSSVEQQRQLVDVAQRQFESERDRYLASSRPIFSVIEDSEANNLFLLKTFNAQYDGGMRKISYKLINRGAMAMNVSTQFSKGATSKQIPRYTVVDSEENIQFWVAVKDDEPAAFDMTVSYFDRAGYAYKSTFRFTPSSGAEGVLRLSVEECPEA